MIITLRIFGFAVASIEVDLAGLAVHPYMNGQRPVDRGIKTVSSWWVGRMAKA
jgi:hypothetical protein